MVGFLATVVRLSLWVNLLAQTTEPVFRRLEPATRVRVLAALAGFVILGFALMLLAWMGSRATRRYMNSEVPPKRSTDDDWATKPLDNDPG